MRGMPHNRAPTHNSALCRHKAVSSPARLRHATPTRILTHATRTRASNVRLHLTMCLRLLALPISLRDRTILPAVHTTLTPKHIAAPTPFCMHFLLQFQ